VAEPASFGITREQAMRRFHVRDAQGRWQSGAWAFVELWTHLPYFRWLAQAVRTLHLVRPLDAVYGPLARWRPSRRCAQGACVPTWGSP
jgi:predicted DCC family thiol-disulfide oxidoreductase YuxK